MTKNTFIIGVIIWLITLLMLVVSLTDFVPNNPLIEFRTVIGVGFLAITYFVRIVYRNYKNNPQ